MRIYYRISNNSYNKNRLANATKERCLANFIDVWFPENVEGYPKVEHNLTDQLIILEDGCNEETKEMVQSVVTSEFPANGYPPQIVEIQGGSGAASFRIAYKMALQNADEELVYFLEDDYLHLPVARQIMLEGLSRAQYVSLYDHPDKYMDEGGNPYVDDGGEITRVIMTPSTHWKMTNSTTMTFATSVQILKVDEYVWMKYTEGQYPRDFEAFIELRNLGRTLITPLPGRSTHTEVQWLTPLVDWRKI